MIAAIVLAAGLSRRMGDVNKLLLPWKDKTILETVVDNLKRVNLSEIIVVAGSGLEQIKTLLNSPSVHIIFNPHFENGMTSSIQIGINRASASSTGFMICLADMPFILPGEYQLLADAFENYLKTDDQTIIVPVYHAKKGNPVIFSSYYREQILEHPEREGCKSIVQNATAHVRLISLPSSNFLKDIDTPEDYYPSIPVHSSGE